MRRPRPALALVAAALVLTSCTSVSGDEPAAAPSTSSAPSSATPSASAAPTAGEATDDVPEALAEFYGQEVAWTSCGETFECAEITVPLDYDDPGGESITLAAKRLLASGEKQGSLVINPGGPGSSGIELAEAAPSYFTAELRDAYDVVGLDPRGVGDSTPVDCVSDAELDRVRAAEYDLETDEGLRAYQADAQLVADGCASTSGDLVANVDTVSAARDLDVVRHVLGEDELDYLGFSYGTYLGATYAELFPERVGRLVLDGAMDPSLSAHETTLAQAVGFESSLRAYAEDCLAGPDCPLSGSVDDAVGQVRTLLELTGDTPLPTADGRELTASLAFSGIITPLYDDSTWFALTAALDQAINEGDGSQLLFLADLLAGREADGSYPVNTTEANWAVNCLDYPVEGDLARWKVEADELEAAAPTIGPIMGYGAVLSDAWPSQGQAEREPVTAAGAPPIMVVGTTGDPATPYEWSVALADQLESGFLVTYDGGGHTAYGRSNDCVNAAVDRFLLEGVVPADGTTC